MAIAADLRTDLLRLVPDERRVSDVESVLEQHGADLSYHAPRRPDVVVYPESTQEVAAVLAYADRARVPVTPFGAGTSLEGHVIPLEGGISLDLTRMSSIVALAADDLAVTVQAGVTRSQVEAAAGLGAGVLWTRCERLDALTIGALNAFSGTSFPESPYLFVEFGGTEAGVTGDLAATRELAEDEGATAFEAESDPTARAQMWNARHNALMASLALAPGSKAMTTDVAVPVSELAAAIEHARRALDDSGLLGGIVGHVGDGNFHVAFLLDPDDAASIAQAEALTATLVDDALARGGTCTGEHGIGYGKLRYLELEHGDLVPLYRGIKQLFDPNGILNPGKVVPAT